MDLLVLVDLLVLMELRAFGLDPALPDGSGVMYPDVWIQAPDPTKAYLLHVFIIVKANASTGFSAQFALNMSLLAEHSDADNILLNPKWLANADSGQADDATGTEFDTTRTVLVPVGGYVQPNLYLTNATCQLTRRWQALS